MADYSRLTIGERLLLRRKQLGETQAQAATRYKVSTKEYRLWERRDEGSAPTPQYPMIRHLSGLDPHERCLIHRRRARLTQAQVAELMGLCRWWVNQMERGVAPCDELVHYWEGQ